MIFFSPTNIRGRSFDRHETLLQSMTVTHFYREKCSVARNCQAKLSVCP